LFQGRELLSEGEYPWAVSNRDRREGIDRLGKSRRAQDRGSRWVGAAPEERLKWSADPQEKEKVSISSQRAFEVNVAW